MEEQLVHLAHQQIQQILSNALHSLVQISSANIIQTKPVRPRSASSHRYDRKLSFHHPHPRSSLPSTANNLIDYRSCYSSSQRIDRSIFHTFNSSDSNGMFDIQYSFSLYQSYFPQVKRSRHTCRTVRNLADELLESSIQMALLEIDKSSGTNGSHISTDEDKRLSLQLLCSHVNPLVRTTFEQSIDQISRRAIERFSDCLMEDTIADTLLSVANYQLDIRKAPRNFRVVQQSERTNSLNRSSHQSFSACQHGSSEKRSMAVFVNSIAQQIRDKSFDKLRKTFETVSDTV